MAIQVDNQEIHRTHLSFDEIYNQKFYEIQNSRTTSSLDNLTGEILYLNFKNKKNNQIQYFTDKVKNDISHWLAFRNEDLKEIVISATTLDTTRSITITVPSAKLINLADGDDAGRQTIVRTYRCQNVLGDDNIKIEIEKGL